MKPWVPWVGAIFVGIVAIWLLLGLPLQGPYERIDYGIPPEIAAFAEDWPLANHDYNNSRATSHSPINSNTIHHLRLAWSFPIVGIGPFGGATSTPLVAGDRVYFQDGLANTYSLDRGNGSMIWQYRPNPSFFLGPNGPGIGYGTVFVGSDAFHLTALDIRDGHPLWTTNITPRPPIGMDIQPTVYDGLVYISTVPGIGDIYYTPGAIGVISALDVGTGDYVWNFSTVDTADIWGHPEINNGGGSWYPPAIDLRTGRMFWGTGNPAPFVGTDRYPNGSSRPGPNLYTNSLLALDHRSGELLWYTQTVPHDIFDYDMESSPILATASISGISQDIVIGSGKMGRVYAFNRSTGAILWECVVGRHEHDQLAALSNWTTVYPGTLGGVETPMAFADGVLYVAYNDLYTNWTYNANFMGLSPPPYIPPYQEGKGGLVAIQVDTGKILWDQKTDALPLGGATVVNDLVFTATLPGEIYAFERYTGNLVWNYTAPAGIAAWPAVAGDLILWPAGGGFGSGGNPALIAFQLGEE